MVKATEAAKAVNVKFLCENAIFQAFQYVPGDVGGFTNLGYGAAPLQTEFLDVAHHVVHFYFGLMSGIGFVFHEFTSKYHLL